MNDFSAAGCSFLSQLHRDLKHCLDGFSVVLVDCLGICLFFSQLRIKPFGFACKFLGRRDELALALVQLMKVVRGNVL